jgi:beta-glucuronidase
MRLLLLAVASLLPLASRAEEPRRISLAGAWKFAADYQDWGERYRWQDPSYGDGVWDLVTVPHTWSMDPRFPSYVGAGWYRLRFATPSDIAGRHVRLAFEAVFARAKVWLNGTLVGEHEGGYTPFEFDVGGLLRRDGPNLLVVRADNRWNQNTIPGAQPGPDPQDQLKAWWDDGGIIRDVGLIITSPVYVVRQKIEAEPLRTGTAIVRVIAWVRNATANEVPAAVSGEMWRGETLLELPVSRATVRLKAGAVTPVELAYRLRREQVSLWGLHAPIVYKLRTSVEGGAALTDTFGIRRFEAVGPRLLLNGEPMRLAGANRIPDHAEWGQNDPVSGACRDMALMKEAGLVFARLSHYPLSRAVLDWADRNGMLLIEEAVGATAPELQDKNRRMYREMIERDWNRPSIVAWSIGNEFASETPEGVRYVREMRDHTRSLDATRLITFATNRTSAKGPPEEEGSYYVDFVSMNTYSDPEGNGANIDRMHQRYPNKPLVVSEFGARADLFDDETEREEWFRQMVAEIRKRPFVSGLSIWSFNDYRSRYVGTNRNGYREWGLVGPRRELRGSYHVLRREFSGFRVVDAQLKGGVVTVRVAVRDDFPVVPPAAAELRLRMRDGQGRTLETKSVAVPAMAPGAVQELKLAAPPGTSSFRGEIRRGDFAVMTFGAVRP